MFVIFHWTLIGLEARILLKIHLSAWGMLTINLIKHFKGFSSRFTKLHTKLNADTLLDFAIHCRQNITVIQKGTCSSLAEVWPWPPFSSSFTKAVKQSQSGNFPLSLVCIQELQLSKITQAVTLLTSIHILSKGLTILIGTCNGLSQSLQKIARVIIQILLLSLLYISFPLYCLLSSCHSTY
jgi:hypothetical protein